MYLSSAISNCHLTAEYAWLNEKVVMDILQKQLKRKYRQHIATHQREGKRLKHTERKAERERQ